LSAYFYNNCGYFLVVGWVFIIIALSYSIINLEVLVSMEREQALEELKARIENENLIKHSLAVEAIMKDWLLFQRRYR